MKQEQLVKSTLDRVHAINPTLKILYDAIERCSNEDYTYHRDLVFDMFSDNESLLKEDENGFAYYTGIERIKNGGAKTTHYEDMIDMINDPELDLDISELPELVEIEYKRFVYMFFTHCLLRLEEKNINISDCI